jgi:hypothetical protein
LMSPSHFSTRWYVQVLTQSTSFRLLFFCIPNAFIIMEHEKAKLPAPPYEVVCIADLPADEPTLRQQCYDVRREVFIDEQKFDLELEIDA